MPGLMLTGHVHHLDDLCHLAEELPFPRRRFSLFLDAVALFRSRRSCHSCGSSAALGMRFMEAWRLPRKPPASARPSAWSWRSSFSVSSEIVTWLPDRLTGQVLHRW